MANTDPNPAFEPSFDKIKDLLGSQNDTERFVGLALLKSTLDSSESIRQDTEIVQDLWSSISVKFIDRLLKTGATPSKPNAKEFLSLAVSVLQTFVTLLPESIIDEKSFTGRIPGLVNSLLYSSEETTQRLLEVLLTFVDMQNGARRFAQVEDISALVEIAPAHPIVLKILLFSWLRSSQDVEQKAELASKVGKTIQDLVAAFTNTDAVTLLDFLGDFLRQADPQMIPRNPKWLGRVVRYIKILVVSRPTPEARAAYTKAAASLLQVYPAQANGLLFTGEETDEKPFSYLFINLILIDIRSSTPTLLAQLNQPDYAVNSHRLGCAFDILCAFIGHLIRSLDDDNSGVFIMPPSSLLKLRKAFAETFSLTIEYLRDRWDAGVAGAMGLHEEARSGFAKTSAGTHHTLAWDSMNGNVNNDPFLLSAIRALSIWIREDDNDMLRKEATGLSDMFIDLYKSSQTGEELDFRLPVLVALEALVTLDEGREILLRHDIWKTLSDDLDHINGIVFVIDDDGEASRGIEVVRVLLQLVELESGTISESWMDMITRLAGQEVPDRKQSTTVQEYEVALLQLACALLLKANQGMLRRYTHSISAIRGIASRVNGAVSRDNSLKESAEDALATLSGLC